MPHQGEISVEPPGSEQSGPGGGSSSADARRLTLALWTLRAGPALMLVAIVVGATISTPLFMTTGNIGNVLDATAVIAVLAIGQLLVILTRGIDLSVGSTLALATVIGALVFGADHGGPLVIGGMLATGLAVGAINGLVFVYGRIPHPFIVTLATLSIARGLALLLSDGRPKFGMPESVVDIGGKSIGWLHIRRSSWSHWPAWPELGRRAPGVTALRPDRLAAGGNGPPRRAGEGRRRPVRRLPGRAVPARSDAAATERAQHQGRPAG